MNRLAVPLPPHSSPALDALVNGDLWERWRVRGLVPEVADVREACRYLRWKADATCRLFIAGEDQRSATDPPEGTMLHLFPDLERAETAYAKEQTRRHTLGSRGFELFLCPESRVVGIPYPNDPEIPDLRRLYDPDRFRRTLNDLLVDYPAETWRIQRSLTRLTLLQYKPGRRAVYRIKVKIRRRVGDEKIRVRMHLKVENPTTCDRSFENLRAIHAAIPPNASWRVPAPHARAERRTVVAAEWVDGTPLRKALSVEAAAPDVLREVGRALAGLHGLSLDLEHLASPVEESDRLNRHAEDLAELAPERREDVLALGRSLAREVSRLVLAPSSVVHGDFHVDQVLLTETGPVLVDLDGAGRGYACHDLGSFLGHLEELGFAKECCDAFRRGYADAIETPVPDDWVRVSRAVALFRRAGFGFRELRTDWPAHLDAMLARVAHHLEGLDG